jgi:hypothetical protein
MASGFLAQRLQLAHLNAFDFTEFAAESLYFPKKSSVAK